METQFDDQAEDEYLRYLKACDDGRLASFDDLGKPERDESGRDVSEPRGTLPAIIALQEKIETWLSPFRGQDAAPLQAQAESPTRIGKYEIDGLLGQGGMGLVYRARQAGFRRAVALKTIRYATSPGIDEQVRFRNEIAAIAALEHAAIVPILDVGDHADGLYYTMPLMENGGLDKHVPWLSKDPKRAVQIVTVIAESLHHAHQRGVLHRDIKPSNILLDSDFRPFLSDFGLAKMMDRDESHLTQTGVMVGTPNFMAPELLIIAAVDDAMAQRQPVRATATIASDIYAMGGVLYTLLQGKVPYHGGALWDLPRRIREEEPARLLDLGRGVDSVLEAICFKCLEKEPNARYSSAQALADDLHAWSNGESTLAKPFTATQRVLRWGRRHRTWVAMLSICLLGILALVGGLSFAYSEVRTAHREVTRQRDRLRERIYGADLSEAFRALRRGDWESYRNSIKPYQEIGSRRDFSGEEFDFLSLLENQIPRIACSYHAFRHPVFQAVFSPDGKWLAAGGAEAEIHLIDVESGKCLCIMKADPTGITGHRLDVNWLRFTTNGERLISAGEDGSVRVWDPKTGIQERILFQGEHCIESFAIGKTSCDVFISDVKGMLRRVRFEDGLVLKVWDSGIGNIECLQITPDERFLIAGGHRDGGIICWDLESYQARWSQPIPATCLSVGTDSKFCWAVDDSIRNHLIDIATGEVLRSRVVHSGIPKAISVSPSGRYVASGGLDGRIRLSLSNHFECDAFWRAHEDTVWSIDVSADDRQLASCSSDGSVKIWKLAEQPSLKTIPLASINAMSWEPHGDRIAFSVPKEQTPDAASRIEIWDMAECKKLEEYGLPIRAHRCWGWSPDGEKIMFSDGNAFWQLGLVDGKIRRQGKVDEDTLTPMSRRADANCLLTNRGGADLFRVDGNICSYRAGAPVKVHSVQGNGWVVKASRLDEDRIGVLYQEGLRLWSTSKRGWVGSPLKLQSTVPLCFSTSLETNVIAIGFASGVVHIYSMEDGRLLLQCSASAEKMVDLEFSPDGQTLLGGGDEGSVLAWKTTTGQLLFVLDESSFQSVISLRFSDDGTRLGILGSPKHGASSFVCMKWKPARR